MHKKSRNKGMRLIILDILSKENLHGYGIAERIAERYGVEKPSSGIIYPVLSELRRKKLIEVCNTGNREKKIYRITAEGLRYLEEHREEVDRAKRFLSNLGEFHAMGGHELVESIRMLVENMHLLSDEERERVERAIRVAARRTRKEIEGAVE